MIEPIQLIERIKTGFLTVKNVEKTLEQCLITNSFGMGGLSEEEFNKVYHKAGTIRPYDFWTEIPNQHIEKHYSPFANMSNEQYAFYLPAYMVYVIENYMKNPQKNWWDNKVLISVAWTLGYDYDYESFKYKYSSMTDLQKSIVLDYACFIVDLTYKTPKDEDFFENQQKKSLHEYHLESVLRAKNKMYIHFAKLK